MPTTNLDLIRGRQVVLPLTNKSGAERVEGAVVIVEIYTDDAFTTGTASGDDLVLGVVAETIANNAEGRVICGGYAPVVEVDAATVRGDYLKTSATPGEATPTATFDVGVFAIALSAVGGAGQVSAYLFGVDGSVGGGGDWTLIQDTELGAPAATIDFVAIPATYKHLAILYSLRSDRPAVTADTLWVRFNNSAVGYDWVNFYFHQNNVHGTGEGINDVKMAMGAVVTAATAQAGSFGSGDIYVRDYLDASKDPHAQGNAGVLKTRATTAIQIQLAYGQWRTASAINRITLLPAVGPNFVAGSRACLYGID